MPSVLVVDSDREVVRAFRSGFTEAEARVLSSHSGEEAVENRGPASPRRGGHGHRVTRWIGAGDFPEDSPA